MSKVFVYPWISNILTHFLEFNTCKWPDFLYIIKYKNEYKTQFYGALVKFSRYEAKINQKTKFFA